MLRKNEPAPGDLKILSLSRFQKMPKLVDSLSGKHALGRKSRMCLDILLVWWLLNPQRPEYSITIEGSKEIKHVTHGSSQHLISSYEEHKTIQEILMEEPLSNEINP